MNNSEQTPIDNRLLYRRQYFIGPKIIEEFPNWNSYKIGKTFVTAHPDLEVSVSKSKNIQSALLGFAFDYENPQFSNSQILDSILEKSNTFVEFVNSTYQLSGRWILIYSTDSEIKIINDPGGLRQVFYHHDGSDIWCSAQPHLLAKLFNENRRKDESIRSFIRSQSYELNERSWMGNDSLYNNIYHLTPNHFLNLNDGKTERYWPNRKLPDLTVDEVVDRSIKIFTALFKAANIRYKTAQIITAGWDTRLLLALNKSQIPSQYFFIHRLPDMDDNHEDIVVPSEIAKKFKLKFDIIDCSSYTSKFDEIITKNVYLKQSKKKRFQFFNYLSQFENKLIISGNVSPLIKEQYHSIDEINVDNLARLMNYQNNDFAKKAISLWLETTKKTVDFYDIRIENLFYWEMRFGSWAPMFNAELDIATEEFSPYNCRDLIILMNSLPSKYRSKPNVLLYNQIISKTWPELLDIPINPQSYSKKNRNDNFFVQITMNSLKKIRIYKFVRKLYRKYILK